jgi:hypothetical protein
VKRRFSAINSPACVWCPVKGAENSPDALQAKLSGWCGPVLKKGDIVLFKILLAMWMVIHDVWESASGRAGSCTCAPTALVKQLQTSNTVITCFFANTLRLKRKTRLHHVTGQLNFVPVVGAYRLYSELRLPGQLSVNGQLSSRDCQTHLLALLLQTCTQCKRLKPQPSLLLPVPLLAAAACSIAAAAAAACCCCHRLCCSTQRNAVHLRPHPLHKHTDHRP